MTSTLRVVSGTTSSATPIHQGERLAPDREAVARQKFDAYFMQAVLEQALPKKADAVFGRGFAGDVMRSMLAEKVAAEISKRGAVSIAGQSLLRPHQASRLSPPGDVARVVGAPDDGGTRAKVR